ncbi:hypothetical protein K435DRAFT_255181 [Dendrothele bispora CBS 962.96]|uniref:Alpha/beta-hydrolase n=1 Tax=Dendrothele bispora (strain CBS 962.96) TaxID=1314807 RepID=A0A4S8LN03_DENBC|nr:hypothetical protein K435DRAFT_255181 [Dendrothele bispora CBS 962.96]
MVPSTRSFHNNNNNNSSNKCRRPISSCSSSSSISRTLLLPLLLLGLLNNFQPNSNLGPLSVSAWEWLDNPQNSVSAANGWVELPPVPNGQLITDFPISGTKAVFPVYQSTGLDNEHITRAVVITGALARDHWSYFVMMQNLAGSLNANDSTFDPSTISIMTPCFLDQNDMDAGAGNKSLGQLYWDTSGWFNGLEAIGPEWVDEDDGDGEDGGDSDEGDGEGNGGDGDEDGSTETRKRRSRIGKKKKKRDQVDSGALGISSFDVLDDIVDHYMDKDTYPNLEEIVFTGHSAAGQFFQRYAALRKSTDNDDKIHYIVGNPASYIWLTSDRPDTPNDTCHRLDSYKYGLDGGFMTYSEEDVANIGRAGVVGRYRKRNVHYSLGTADFGVSDETCRAMAQGSSHLDRGLNFIMLLESMVEGMPSTHTVDWIDGVGHEADKMYDNPVTVDRLFRTGSPSSTGERPATSSVYVTTANADEYMDSQENGAAATSQLPGMGMGIGGLAVSMVFSMVVGMVMVL